MFFGKQRSPSSRRCSYRLLWFSFHEARRELASENESIPIAGGRPNSDWFEEPLVNRSANMGPDQTAILEKQRYFQSVHKLTHLKGPRDRVTSVVIPFILLGAAGFMMTTGLSKLYTGTGKKEGV